jgi:hypothetical protein
MTAVLPIGYITILAAAEMLQPAMYAGVPDMPIVTKLRQKGIEVNDGPAIDRAVAELWKAVDKGTLRSVAIAGRPRRIVRLDAQFTKGVPALRNPRGRGFTLVAAIQPCLSPTGHMVWTVTSRGYLGFSDEGDPGVGAQIDAGPAHETKNKRTEKTPGSLITRCRCQTSDQGCDRTAKMERDDGDEGIDQRGQPCRKMVPAGEPRYRDPGTRSSL